MTIDRLKAMAKKHHMMIQKDGHGVEFLTFIRNNDMKQVFRSQLMKEVTKAVDAVRNDKEKEVAYMTYVAKLEDTRREGLAEGRKEGQKEERKKAIRRLLSKYSPSEIATLMDYPIDEVEAVASEDR